MKFTVEAIGHVRAERSAAVDDDWGGTQSVIELDPHFEPDALAGLASFSHVEVIYLFHRVEPEKIVSGARYPRNNLAWPKIGIFAQRGKNRPNRIGSTICRIVEVRDRALSVAELDAIDGSPVLDLKPVMQEFLPRGALVQPQWSTELMRNYWRDCTPGGEAGK